MARLVRNIGIFIILSLTFGCQMKKGDAEPQVVSEAPMAAAMKGDLPLLRKLDEQGVDLDLQYPRRFGWTPLMGAIYSQQTDAAAYLIDRGVNLRKRDATGNTALMWAIQVGDTNTAALMVRKSPEQLRTGEDWPKVSALIAASESPVVWSNLLSAFPMNHP